MKVLDGRGQHTKKEAEKNKKDIKLWFKENPNRTIKECCESLNLSRVTVRKHVRDLQSA